MQLQHLQLKAVGPFAEVHLDFPSRITLLTGLNGSGKTIVLDALRFWFGGQYGLVERPLRRAGSNAGDFLIAPRFSVDGRTVNIAVADEHHANRQRSLSTGQHAEPLWGLPNEVLLGGSAPGFVLDYWCPSTNALGAYEISSLEVPNHRQVFLDALSGAYTRARTTQLLAHAEFLKDSYDAQEMRTGKELLRILSSLVEGSLLEGRYVGINRSTLTPYVEQAGQRITLAGLSAGNAYLLNRLVGLLSKMYSLHALHGGDPAELTQTPGLLLIDEVENHLHPRWQKSFLPLVAKLFPRLQIIATTHSPLVLSSVPEACVYLARYNPKLGVCELSDETQSYHNRSVEEILVSSAFEGTTPWGSEIVALLKQRDEAVASGDTAKKRALNKELVRRNPVSFAYLRVENELELLAPKPASKKPKTRSAK